MKWGPCLLPWVCCIATVEGGLLRRAGADLAPAQPKDVDMIKVSNMMKALDGQMNFAEFEVFIKAIADKSNSAAPAQLALQEMFKDIDTNNDKSVSVKEFMHFQPLRAAKAAAAAIAQHTPPMAPMTPMAAPVAPMAAMTPVAAAAGSTVQGKGLKCVAWRKTSTCVPSGPRDPLQDKDCLSIIGSEESGFCECEGLVHTAAVPCGHGPVHCTKECGILQKMHRETFGADISSRASTPLGGPAVVDNIMPGGQIAATLSNKDPYDQALKYGNRAVRDVSSAVADSNQLLGSARDMIAKMMNLKPWSEITKLGKDAEEAGKKTEMLAKLARPFIYTQIDGTSK